MIKIQGLVVRARTNLLQVVIIQRNESNFSPNKSLNNGIRSAFNRISKSLNERYYRNDRIFFSLFLVFFFYDMNLIKKKFSKSNLRNTIF
jgi:hypothetical protein